MLAQVQSATILGVEGHRVQVEVHVAQGLPSFTIVGLPDASCRESRDRVRAAVQSCKLEWPQQRVTVNLAPTHLRKAGSGLDLAIAVGVLVATRQLPPAALDEVGFLGELGLDGTIRAVPGVLAALDALGDVVPVVPLASLAEARLLRPDARSSAHLGHLVPALRGDEVWPDPPPVRSSVPLPAAADLADVQGQVVARAALEVAAAGGHHLLLNGPPGAGKTMLADRLVGILPDLDEQAAMEVSRIHSVASQLRAEHGLPVRPPFRAPHHTSSLVALVGGGSATLRPGEISLASRGVLFLDELGEFPVAHLDALRQPLEHGTIQVARAHHHVTLPARFLLVAATNPCPCGQGRWGDCTCSPSQVARYLRRLSGPLVDRFDLRLDVDPPDPGSVLRSGSAGEASSVVRGRVVVARSIAASRGVACNRDLGGDQLDACAPLTPDSRELLREHLAAGRLSMRGAQRVRAVARTLADLDGIDGPPGVCHLQQAVALRGVRSPARVPT